MALVPVRSFEEVAHSSEIGRTGLEAGVRTAAEERHRHHLHQDRHRTEVEVPVGRSCCCCAAAAAAIICWSGTCEANS